MGLYRIARSVNGYMTVSIQSLDFPVSQDPFIYLFLRLTLTAGTDLKGTFPPDCAILKAVNLN